MRGRATKVLRKMEAASGGKAKYPLLKIWWSKLNHKEKGAIKR